MIPREYHFIFQCLPSSSLSVFLVTHTHTHTYTHTLYTKNINFSCHKLKSTTLAFIIFPDQEFITVLSIPFVLGNN